MGKRSFDTSIFILLLIPVMLTGHIFNPAVSLVIGSFLLLLLIIRSQKINFNELIIILPLILILFIGIIGSLYHRQLNSGSNLYLVGKDTWYFLKPVIYLLIGFYIYRVNISKELFQSFIVYISLIFAFYHIIKVLFFVLSPDNEGYILDTLKARTSIASILEAFSLVYIIKLSRFNEIRKYMIFPRWLLITVLSFSIMVSFSRTVIISFFISLLAFNSFFSFRLNTLIKSSLKLLIFLFAAILLLICIYNISSKGSNINLLTGKFLNSFTEVTFKKMDASYIDINHNWRGYETNLVWKEIRRGTGIEKLFGFGFGKTVFVGYGGYLGPENIFIPIFHNGFIQIILKTGLAGLLLYLAFFFTAFFIADRNNPSSDSDNYLKAVIVTAFLATLVITGLYNISILDPACVIMGYFLGMNVNYHFDANKA